MKRMPSKATHDNIKSQITFLPFLLFAALFLAFLIVLPAFDMSVLPHALLRVDAASQQLDDGAVLWQDVLDEKSIPYAGNRFIIPRKYRILHLDVDGFKKLLDSAPLEQQLGGRGGELQVAMPMPNRTFSRFLVVESPIVVGGPTHQFPGIKTYAGQGIDDQAATMRFDWTPQGLHVMVLSPEGTVYIDPYGSGTVSEYISYNAQDYTRDKPYGCLVGEGSGKNAVASPGVLPAISNGGVLRTFDLAVATTGEYTAAVGGPGSALSNVVTAVNRVNAIYERDLSVRFMLVTNESALIFSDASTDPYTNSNPYAMLPENQTALDTLIGSSNYDIGHVFGTGTFGTADRSVVCGGWKAHGVSAYFPPVDRFAVEMMSHEIGHQFGAHHSFNGTIGDCGNVGGLQPRDPNYAYEPGGGTTIMAYVYGCGSQSIQNLKDDYFSTGGLQDMLSFINGSGGTCSGQTSTGNTPPTVDAGGDFNVPKGTPFTLTATGNDPNGDAVTYTWEELDLGTQSPPDSDADGQARPIFRSRPPTTSPTRTFPALNYILDSANVAPTNLFWNGPSQFLTAESLATMTRTMTFQVTARDNRSGGGGISSDAMLLNVTSTAGPFCVIEPNTATVWTPGSHTVKWNVANTTSPPVSCSYVRIKLSTDGGNTFPTLLADNVPNTGSAIVSIPFVTINTARIKVEAIGNIFFDVSDTNFVIPTSGCTYSISPLTNSIPWNPPVGTDYYFSVTGGKSCTWQAKSNAPWITITSGGGTKNGTVRYVVLTNQDGAPRTGTISLAGQLHTVTQQASGTCSYSVNPSTALFDQAGGTGRIDIGASTPACNWTATSNAPWIVVFSGSASLGNGIVLYSVAFNDTGSQRVGTLTVAGMTVTVTQSVPISGGNNAMSLNGWSSYAEVPSSSSLDITGSITVEAWIKTNTITPQQSIMERYSPTGGGFALRLDAQNKVVFLTLANSFSGNAVQGVTPISLNIWHHVAGVYNGATLKIYIDGVEDSSVPCFVGPSAGNSSLEIGARGDDASFKFSGLIDEARLTSGALYTTTFTPQTCLSGTSSAGLWKFDDQTANDSSNNHNNGTLVGGPAFTGSQTCGAPPSYFSLSLNGSSAYVDVPANPSLDITQAITVEAWINTNTITPQQSIMERYSFTGGGFALRLDGQNKVVFFTLANSGSGTAVQGVTPISLNTWHHVAGVYNGGGTLKVYIDGVENASAPCFVGPSAGNSSLKIGARGDDSAFKFSGLVDEARLTAAAVYTSSFTPQPHLTVLTGTRGLWKFDSQNAADSSTNNNNGTLIGGAAFSTNVPQ